MMTEPRFVMRSRPVLESLARPSEELNRRLAVVDADLAEVMAAARLPRGSRRVNRLAERLRPRRRALPARRPRLDKRR